MTNVLTSLLLLASTSIIGACCSAEKRAAVEPTPTGPTPTEPAPTEPIPTEPAPTEAPPVVSAPDEPAIMCGGIAALPCPEGMFCDVPGHCGAGDQSGVCLRVPQMCTRDYRPVCGCDGQTHGNACTAHAAGVSVRAPGECKAP